ncbi:MAG: hypothetical protein GX413_07035 [Acetobacter sp.]|nr:hypothetical protein [Acetobacter sp.]
MQELYNGEDYIVRFFKGSSNGNFIIVSFSGMSAKERKDSTFFGYKLATKLDIPWIGIIAKKDSWYRSGDYFSAFNIVRSWIIARKKENSTENVTLLGYGVSMGGYAVIKYSNFFKFDIVFSMCPQFSIDLLEVKHVSRFQKFYMPFMRNMGIKKSDTHGLIYVFFDPYDKTDANEAQLIRQNSESILIPVCYAGHMVTDCLKGSEIFRLLLDNSREHNKLIRLVSSFRRNSIGNRMIMFNYYIQKNPLIIYKFLKKLKVSDIDIIKKNNDFVNSIKKLSAKLSVLGFHEESLELLTNYSNEVSVIHSTYYLISWIGEFVCYDIREDKFYQTYNNINNRGCIVVYKDCNIYIAAPLGLIPIKYKIKKEGNHFFIMHNNNFISSRPDGSMSLVSHKRNWEKYGVIPIHSYCF